MGLFWTILTVCTMLHGVIAGNFTTKGLAAVDTTYANGDFRIKGFMPDGAGPYPVYMYTTGTSNAFATDSNMQTCARMAALGFIAVQVEYASGTYPTVGGCNSLRSKTARAYASDDPKSATSVLCALPAADCSLGVAVSGFSQGAHIASLAAAYDKRVTAALLIGNGNSANSLLDFSGCLNYGTADQALDRTRIRSIVGDADGFFGCDYSGDTCRRPTGGIHAQQVATTGWSCAPPARTCLTDGAGWYIVSKEESGLPSAVHCIAWESSGCGAVYTPAYTSSAPWADEANLRWLAKRATS